MTTPNLALPELAASQAQPHITHNAALHRLDGLVQLAVLARLSELPTGSPDPAEGDRYMIIDGSPSPAPESLDNIAQWTAGAWVYHAPQTGWLCWVIAERKLYVYEADSPAGWNVLASL